MIKRLFYKGTCLSSRHVSCSNICINKLKTCDFIADCGNNRDESCDHFPIDHNIEYCKFGYNSLDEPKTIVHFPYLSLFNCSKKICSKGYFLCSKFQFCIDIKLVCDGINHCFFNEDEQNCSKSLINISIVNF